jgi:hypothetical protein
MTTVVIVGYSTDRENAKPLANSVIIATNSDILRASADQTNRQLVFDAVAGRLPRAQTTAGLYHPEGKISEI